MSNERPEDQSPDAAAAAVTRQRQREYHAELDAEIEARGATTVEKLQHLLRYSEPDEPLICNVDRNGKHEEIVLRQVGSSGGGSITVLWFEPKPSVFPIGNVIGHTAGLDRIDLPDAEQKPPIGNITPKENSVLIDALIKCGVERHAANKDQVDSLVDKGILVHMNGQYELTNRARSVLQLSYESSDPAKWDPMYIHQAGSVGEFLKAVRQEFDGCTPYAPLKIYLDVGNNEPVLHALQFKYADPRGTLWLKPLNPDKLVTPEVSRSYGQLLTRMMLGMLLAGLVAGFFTATLIAYLAHEAGVIQMTPEQTKLNAVSNAEASKMMLDIVFPNWQQTHETQLGFRGEAHLLSNKACPLGEKRCDDCRWFAGHETAGSGGFLGSILPACCGLILIPKLQEAVPA